MHRITEFADQDLRWSQPTALKKEFELCVGEELVATLKFRSSFGSFATAESAEGCWTFKRVGFWQNKASVRVCDSDSDVAVFENNTWSTGGSLRFDDGQDFRATTNIWQTKLAFETEAGDELLRMRSGGVFRRSAGVEISSLGRHVPQLPILVLFAWYLAIMLSDDTTTIVAATT